MEAYQLLSILGGIPWYLEQIRMDQSVAENIKRLCFNTNGLMVREFSSIFHDLFDDRGAMQQRLLNSLDDGMKTLADVRDDIELRASGWLSECMNQLITCGFVSRQAQWSFATGALKKQSLYRISDPFVRFYLRYMEPNLAKIEQGYFNRINPSRVPGFDAQIGLQVENLLLENRMLLFKALGLDPVDCVMDGPYRQDATQRVRGCQVDYLVQMRSKTLYVCEFKFQRGQISSEIINEMKEKMKRLSTPRGFAVIPVLMHIGEVAETVYSSDYFYRIIDISQFLDESESM